MSARTRSGRSTATTPSASSTEPATAVSAPQRRRSAASTEGNALARLPVFADALTDTCQFLGHVGVRCDDLVERVGDLAREPDAGGRQAHGEISVAYSL